MSPPLRNRCLGGLVLVGLVLVLVAVEPTAAVADDGPPGEPPQPPPVQVFVLAGQSNMQGHGAVRTLDWLGEDEKYGHLLKKLKRADGSWAVRDDVRVYYRRDPRTLKKGMLTVGYGAGDDRIGPELMFGHVVGEHYENPVLLIKTAWGGKSLAVDFRPPGAGGETGPNYTEMIETVRAVLEDLGEHFPEWRGRDHELAGFVWFQGWNDMVDAGRVAEYEANLLHLIRDVRRDLGAPGLPFVIGELGVGGAASAEDNPRMAGIRRAQAAPAKRPELKGTVAFVATSRYWDQRAHDFLTEHWVKRKWSSEEARQQFERMGSQPPYHYLGSGKIYSLIGHGFAEAMLDLRRK